MLTSELDEMSLFFMVTMNMGEAYPEGEWTIAALEPVAGGLQPDRLLKAPLPLAQSQQSYSSFSDDYEVLRQISEIVSEPLDVLELEMASFVNKYPDISHDQCTALLALRGDMNIKEIK